MEHILTADNISLVIILVLSQIIQAMVIKKGQAGGSQPVESATCGEEGGCMTEQEHTWLEQIWTKLCRRV